MVKLTLSDISHVAKLSELNLSENEIVEFREQLTEVVEYFDKLKEVNVEKTPPTSQTTGLVNKKREDKVDVLRIVPRDLALSNAPREHNGYFVVDALIDKEKLE